MSAIIAVLDIEKHLFMDQVVTKEIESINISFVKDAKISYEIWYWQTAHFGLLLGFAFKTMLADWSLQFLSKHSLLRCFKNMCSHYYLKTTTSIERTTSSQKIQTSQRWVSLFFFYKCILDQDGDLNTNE